MRSRPRALIHDAGGAQPLGQRSRAARLPADLLRDDRFRRAIGVNEHDGVEWFNKERLEHALKVLALPRARELRTAAERAGYRLDRLMEQLAASSKRPSTGRVRSTGARDAKPAAGKRAGRR